MHPYQKAYELDKSNIALDAFRKTDRPFIAYGSVGWWERTNFSNVQRLTSVYASGPMQACVIAATEIVKLYPPQYFLNGCSKKDHTQIVDGRIC